MYLTSPILVILLLLVSTLVFVLVVPRNDHGLQSLRTITLWCSLLALAVGLAMGLSFDKATVGYQYMSSIGFIAEYNSALALGVDGLSYVFLVLTLFTFPFLFLAAWNVTKFPNHFFAHLFAMEILLVLTFVTIDLFYFFVLFESLLIPMFLLIGGWGARTRKIKAAYYFFLYTFFGSLFMLFGMIYLYQLTGSLNYYIVLAEIIDLKTQKFLWVCFFLAFAVKMPLFPLHIWLPEAHVEAPTVGSMLLASLLLKLGGYGLLRFSLTFLSSASLFFTAAVATLAIAGVIYGSLSTMRQIDMKRIIAYSSVAHMNLVALGIFSFNRIGIEGSIYLMVAHGVVSAALFFCVGVVYDRTHTRLLRYYGGLVTVMPLFASLFFIFNLANMGFPGTPNFIGELLLLAGVYKLAPTVVFPSANGIVFSAAYSTLLFARVCFGTLKTDHITAFKDVSRREATILVGLLSAMGLLGLRTDIVFAYLESVVWIITNYSGPFDDAAASTVLAIGGFAWSPASQQKTSLLPASSKCFYKTTRSSNTNGFTQGRKILARVFHVSCGRMISFSVWVSPRDTDIYSVYVVTPDGIVMGVAPAMGNFLEVNDSAPAKTRAARADAFAQCRLSNAERNRVEKKAVFDAAFTEMLLVKGEESCEAIVKAHDDPFEALTVEDRMPPAERQAIKARYEAAKDNFEIANKAERLAKRDALYTVMQLGRVR